MHGYVSIMYMYSFDMMNQNTMEFRSQAKVHLMYFKGSPTINGQSD